MSRLRSWLEDVLFWLLAIQLMLYVCAVYWVCRIFGVEVDE